MNTGSSVRMSYILGYAVLFAVSFFSAFGVLYEFEGFDRWFIPIFVPLVPWMVILKLAVFGLGGFFRKWPKTHWQNFIVAWVCNLATVFSFFVAGRFVSCQAIEQFRHPIFLIDFLCTLFLVRVGLSVVTFNRQPRTN